MIYAPGDDFFVAATFKGLSEVSFQTERKSLYYNLVCMSLLCISREEKTKLTLFMRSKFSFPYIYTMTLF